MLEPFDLHEAMAALIARFSAAAREKRLGLKCSLADDLPRNVVGDAGMVMGLLERLLDHAVRVAERGEIVLAARRDFASRVRFQVAHTGSGMTPEASLQFVCDLNPDLGIHTAPQSGSTIWFFAQLQPVYQGIP